MQQNVQEINTPNVILWVILRYILDLGFFCRGGAWVGKKRLSHWTNVMFQFFTACGKISYTCSRLKKRSARILRNWQVELNVDHLPKKFIRNPSLIICHLWFVFMRVSKIQLAFNGFNVDVLGNQWQRIHYCYRPSKASAWLSRNITN